MIVVVAGVGLYSRVTWLSSPGLMCRTWGWITPVRIESHAPGQVLACQWQDVLKIEFTEPSILVMFEGQSSLRLTPSDLLDENWSTLINWLKRRDPSTREFRCRQDEHKD
jgi:hypothetical protein